MKTDARIKDDVLQELAWQSGVNKTEIGVIVKDGIVTLTGVITSYSIHYTKLYDFSQWLRMEN